MNTSHEHLYYLDPWFIAREYEARTNTLLPSTIKRSSSTQIQASAIIAKAQGTSQESIEFQQTPEKAFWDISGDLDDFPSIEANSEQKLPPVFWVNGILGLYGQKKTRRTLNEAEVIDEIWSFSISFNDSTDMRFRLLADDTYFRYNIQQLIQHPMTLGSNFRPGVRALLKSHGDIKDKRGYIVTPLVIIKNAV